MATTLTTNNPLGMGYQTGYFSGEPGEPLAQSFFDSAFAGRINENKIYRAAYHCNLVDECTMSTWLDEIMGYRTDCYPSYTLLETYGDYQMVKVGATVVIAAYPATTQLHLDDNSHFVNGQYILPQEGQLIVLTPIGELAKVMNVNLASAGDSIIGLQLVNQTASAQTVTQGDELMVLSGSYVDDCECPTGQFRVNDLPIEHDLTMVTIGDKGNLCGDALLKCQWLKIPFTDECGEEIQGMWYNESLRKMYRDFERRKHFERLLNPNWGLIPTIKARGMKWTPASASEITTDDVRNWKKLLAAAGISCREYAVFAGTDLFSQWQRMLLAAGVTKLDNITWNPAKDCQWINMQYCGIMVEGLTLHIYEECSFSNGKMLGSGTSVFPDSAIIVPMCNRPACRRSSGVGEVGGSDNKSLSTVYFREEPTGRVWDNITDSNGYLNGPGGRNTFGTGCVEHEWTVQTRFLQEVHCPNQWGYMGLS